MSSRERGEDGSGDVFDQEDAHHVDDPADDQGIRGDCMGDRREEEGQESVDRKHPEKAESLKPQTARLKDAQNGREKDFTDNSQTTEEDEAPEGRGVHHELAF